MQNQIAAVPQKFKVATGHNSCSSVYTLQTIGNRDSDVYTPPFTAALFTLAKRWQQPKGLSSGEWIKQDVAHETMGYYVALKKGGDSGTHHHTAGP